MLQTALIFLLAAVLVVPIAKWLKLGAVLGYLVAGMAIGPSVLGLAGNAEAIAHVSELGVVLLLFIIGLELSPRRLWVMRRDVFGVGLVQVAATGLVIAAIARFGFALELRGAVVLGLALALSSTAFGLQILAERKQLQTPSGRLSFSILLFQDIAAIPLIAVIPLLDQTVAASSGLEMLTAFGRVLLVIALVVVGGRYLLRPFLPRGCQDRHPGGIHRCRVAGGAWHGLAGAAGRHFHGAGCIPGRCTAGRLGIPARTGIAPRALQGPAAGPVLHQRGHVRQPAPADSQSVAGGRTDGAADDGQGRACCGLLRAPCGGLASDRAGAWRWYWRRAASSRSWS